MKAASNDEEKISRDSEDFPRQPLRGRERNRGGESEVHARGRREQMKTSEARHQPEAGGNRANDCAERIPRIGAAHRCARAGSTGRTRAGNQHHNGRKIKSEDHRRGKHGQRAGDKLGEHEAAKRFVRRAQNRREHFDQAREEHQEGERGERRQRLRDGEGHRARLAAAAPSFKQRAPQNDSREERAQHQRERVRRAAQLRREQARPADFVGHGRGADDCETNQEKSRWRGRRRRFHFFRRSSFQSKTLGQGSSRARNSASAPAARFSATAIPSVRRNPSEGKKKKSRRECSGNRACRVDPVEARQARSQLRRIPREPAHQHGQRAAHQKCRQEQDQRRSHKSQRQQSAGVSAGVGIRGHIDRADAGQSRERNCGGRGHAKFQPPVERDRPVPALAPRRPIHALPEASPAMNTARTVATAYAVWPKISPSALLHTT